MNNIEIFFEMTARANLQESRVIFLYPSFWIEFEEEIRSLKEKLPLLESKVETFEKLISDRNENMAYDWLVNNLRDNGQLKESYAVAQLIELWRMANENYEFEKHKILSSPARVAGRVFKAGDSQELVIEASYRQYEFNPPKSTDGAVCFPNYGHDYGDNDQE